MQSKDLYLKECHDLAASNTVIEVDGTYWHNYPTGRELDHIRNKELSEAGYAVLRFWEGKFTEIDVQNALGRGEK